ncbi:4-alpha-glucanotransferase, partial [Enterococcus hirae]
DIAQRKPKALDSYRKKFSEEIKLQYWMQYEFNNQWNDLKKYANDRGIRVVGDIPIFVDHNSADVWANPEYFEVDKQGNR